MCPCRRSSAACSIISSQVFGGGFLTRSLRYQSSWVLDGERAPRACPCTSRSASGPASVPSLARPARARPVHGLDPAGLGELGGPDHVHADDVDVGVLGGEAADEQLALLVGVGRQPDVARSCSGRWPACCSSSTASLVGAAGLVEDVPVERPRAARRLVAAARRSRAITATRQHAIDA